MHRRVRKKLFRRAVTSFSFLLIVGCCAVFFADTKGKLDFISFGKKVNITIEDNSSQSHMEETRSKTVCEALNESAIILKQDDKVEPTCESRLTSGEIIIITRAKYITLLADSEEKQLLHYGDKNVYDILAMHDIAMSDNDIISLEKEYVPRGDEEEKIEITRVGVREEVETKRIPYKNIDEESAEQEVGYKKITTGGEEGQKEVTYNVTYHNGEEVEREEVAEKIVKEPVNQITTIGIKEVPKEVQVGKSHSGQASWYAYKGCDCAANPWLPKGSYVKVTNTANGKSVVVMINDRGPFVPGRIIDLDKTAFAKIASIGAGVINVTMEEVIE